MKLEWLPSNEKFPSNKEATNDKAVDVFGVEGPEEEIGDLGGVDVEFLGKQTSAPLLDSACDCDDVLVGQVEGEGKTQVAYVHVA